MGIAELSSAAVAVTVRDDWLGWTPEIVIRELQAQPKAMHGRWLLRILAEAIDGIYKVDFLEEGRLTPAGLSRPTKELIDQLLSFAKEEREKHYRLMQKRQYKQAIPAEGHDEEFWLAQVRTHLFRAKRAEELARLLSVKMVFGRYLVAGVTRQHVAELASSGAGRTAIAKLLRKAKADRVSTAVADVTVCGALPHWNSSWRSAASPLANRNRWPLRPMFNGCAPAAAAGSRW